MSQTAELEALEELTARLTDPQDRQRYAELISYFRRLPPGDELFRLAQLFGLLTLLTQKAPEGLQQFLNVVDQQTEAAALYHRQLDARLAQLPAEITAGVHPNKVADAMSERFRQQLASSGLQDTGRLLLGSVKELKTVAADLAQTVKPIQERYSSIGAEMETEIQKLDNASSQLRHQTENLMIQTREQHWLWRIAVVVILLFVGFFVGSFWEKSDTNSMIAELQQQIALLQQTLRDPPPVSPPPSTSKHPKKG